MTPTQATSAPRSVATWRLPLFRSGHLLVANAAITAGVGFAFWLVAARLYPAAVVGSNATAISAMMFLAGLAQLNLMSLLLRFVPAAGRHAGRLILRAYLLAAVLSALSAFVFVLGLRTWAPSLATVLHGPTVAAFVVATAAWSTFVMQDNILVAVQRPGLVAVENLVFAALKLALLVPGAALLATSGVWYAWAISTGGAVCGTTWYLFARAIPRFAAAAPAATESLSLRGYVGYLVPDYVGSVAWIAGTSLVPVLVLNLTDPKHAAAFALSWSIGFTLFAVPAAFGQSLVAHGAAGATDADADHRRVRRHLLLLLTPVAGVLILVAPYIMGIFGSWYENEGTTTLRLVVAAAVPNVVVALAVSHARVTRRMRTVVITLVALSAVVVGLTVWFVPRIGIAGAGWAWVAGETVVAAAVLLAPATYGRFIRATAGGASAPAVARAVATLAAEGWRVDRTVSTVSDTAVLFVHRPDRAAVVKVCSPAHGASLLARETQVLAQLHSDARLGTWRELLPVRLLHVAEQDTAFVIDTLLPGRPGTRSAPPSTRSVWTAISHLHRLDPHCAVVGDELLQSWVHLPADAVRASLAARQLPVMQVDALVDELLVTLGGREVRIGWTHGDLHPGNVLVAESGRISGLIDWSQARDTDPAELDLALWLLTAGRGGSLGRQVAGRLRRDEPWTRDERAWLDGDAQLPPRAVLLLAWLRHVSGNLAKSDRYARSPLWLRRAVLPVLEAVQR